MNALARALLVIGLVLGASSGCGRPKARPTPASAEPSAKPAPTSAEPSAKPKTTQVEFEDEVVLGALEKPERSDKQQALEQLETMRKAFQERERNVQGASQGSKASGQDKVDSDPRQSERVGSGRLDAGRGPTPVPVPAPGASRRSERPRGADGPVQPPSNPVDELLRSLGSANAAFNTPDKMSLGEAQTIQLLLSPVHSQEALAAMVRGPGEKVTVNVKYHHRMRATLQVDPKDPDANAFQIEALSPVEQAVSGEDVTPWTWKVTPRTPGIHYLTLELSVVLEVDHAPVPRTLKQINRTIEIRVPPRDRWNGFIVALALLLVAGVICAVILAGLRRRRRAGAAASVRSSVDPHLFISYARRDTERVLRVVEGLQGRGYRTWMDQTGIDGATLWSQEIVESLRGCQVVLVFASRASFQSEFVTKEILLASEERKPILPLYLEEVAIPSSIRLQLAGIQHLILRPERPEEDLDAIQRALQRLGVTLG